jgi:hypothetical protein
VIDDLIKSPQPLVWEYHEDLYNNKFLTAHHLLNQLKEFDHELIPMLVVSDSAHGCRALAIIFTEWHHQQFEQMCVVK